MQNSSPSGRHSPEIPKAVRVCAGVLALSTCLVGCGDADLNEIVEQPVPSVSFEVTPDAVDFGARPVGEAGQELAFRVENTGEAEVVLAGVEPVPGSDLDIWIDSPMVPPGESRSVLVSWEPTRPGRLSEKVKLRLGAAGQELEETTVVVKGTAIGPSLALSVSDYDFGDTPLGCDGTLNVTVSNPGNEDLVVHSVSQLGDSDFALQLGQPLPWVVVPFGSAQFSVKYSPDDVDGNAAAIAVQSNAGAAQALVTGHGTAELDETVSVVVAERKAATIIFHVNAVAIGTTWSWIDPIYAKLFEKSLLTFFEAMQATGVDYRVAFVWNKAGTVDGGEYIDHTVAPAAARRKALEQLKAGHSTNEDGSLAILLAAIRANELWLFENEVWEDSKLSLIAINNDDDWSMVAPAAAVAEARSYKESPADVVFHSIAVSTGGTCGVAHGPYRDAVVLSGGTTLDFCDLDWDDHMRKLVANSVVGGRQDGAYYVPLTGTPLVSSIRVDLDGRPLPGNWRYDPASNSVVFDLSYAFDGSDLQVSYRGSNECGS